MMLGSFQIATATEALTAMGSCSVTLLGDPTRLSLSTVLWLAGFDSRSQGANDDGLIVKNDAVFSRFGCLTSRSILVNT